MASCQQVLPRGIDVFVTVNKPQAAQTLGTDIALIASTTDAAETILHGERLRSYTTLTGVQTDYPSATEPYKAAREYFAQSPRPQELYIGRVFTTDQGAYGFSRAVTAVYTDFTSITDGEFSVTIDGDQEDITALNFSTDTDMDDVAATVQAGLQAVGTGGYTAATFTWDSSTSQFKLTSGTTGATSTIAATGLSPVSGGSGTDISGDSYLAFYDDPNDDTDNLLIVDGYTLGGIADELALLYNTALGCLNKRWYGLILTDEFRDAGDPALPADFDVRDAAAWAEANFVLLGTDTNDPNTLLSAQTDDVASDFTEAGYSRAFVVYHDNPAYYPSSSALARLLAVDYDGFETVITNKFKDLPGVPTVPISSADLTVLEGKRCNTIAKVAGGQRYYREGFTSSTNWFTDERRNLDALADEIESRVLTLLLQQGRVGFNARGQSQLYGAIAAACDQFIRNGTITDRNRDDGTIDPAYTITIPTPLQLSSGDRAAREWNGITVDVNLTGATHSVSIQVNAFV
jgi:hypothetical protein